MKDLTFALRFLRKRWAFTSVAVVVMALGISLTSTMFAIINGVVLGGPDYQDLDRIVFLRTTVPQSQFHQSVRVHDYMDWGEQNTVFDEMAAYYNISAIVSGDGDRAERFRGIRLSASTFDLVGVGPLMGRTFTPEEDYVPDLDLVVLAYHVWANRYGSDPNIVGSTIRLNARPTVVVGVMPSGFRFPESHDMWLPLNMDPIALARGEGRSLQVIARMSPGITEQQVRGQLETVAQRLEQQFPEANEDIVPVVDLWMDIQFVDGETKGILYTMFVAVFGVLLIACANVMNLLSSLTMARSKEIAVRTALGADRRRVMRQLLLESLVLASTGALIGIALTKFSLTVFVWAIADLNPPSWITFEIGPSVLLFVIGVTLVSAFVAGFVPALHATRSDVAEVLKDQSRGGSGRSTNRWSAGMVGLEVAVSCALLVGAGLMVRSSLAVGANDYGVRSEGLVSANVNLPGETYADSSSRIAVVDRIQRELEAIPGVTLAFLSSDLPGLGTSNVWYGVRDRDYADNSDYSFSGMTTVTEDFFAGFDIPLLSGREFDTRDAMGAERVVIVDQQFAEKNWPGQDPLGRQVRLGRSDSENPWMSVVGVIPSIQMESAEDFGGNPPEGLFLPARQRPMGGFTVTLKTAGDPLGLSGALREAVNRIDIDLPVGRIQTHEKSVRDANLQFTIIGWMFSIFGVVALALASVGLYAVMAFSVTQREIEVGVRMALGAHPSKIVQLIFLQGSKPLIAGLAVGLVLAFALGQALSSQLYGVSATDPLSFVGIPFLLSIVSALALFIPARRASRIEPVVALRDD